MHVAPACHAWFIFNLNTEISSFTDYMVHWRSVHPQTDHVTFRPTLFVHPTNRLLWHFTTVTFRLKVDGLSVHPKLWHSDLVNLDGLSQCHCDILSQSLWHFVRVFFFQLCCDISFKRDKRSIFPENSPVSAHFHVLQRILKGTVSWDFLLFS